MSEQITITVPNKIFRQIAQKAKQNRKNVSDIVEDVVTNTFSQQISPSNPAREKMLQEIDAYKNMHASLVKTYLGQFVAIYNGQLVDHDPDKNVLFLRIKERFPNQIVLQRQVLADPDPILHFRSPRFSQK